MSQEDEGKVSEKLRATKPDPVLERVTGTFTICSACLDGEVGECHTPGCILWLNRAPDLPIRGALQMHECKIERGS